MLRCVYNYLHIAAFTTLNMPLNAVVFSFIHNAQQDKRHLLSDAVLFEHMEGKRMSDNNVKTSRLTVVHEIDQKQLNN